MGTAQILSLTTEQVVALTTRQVQNLSTRNITALSTEQIVAIETEDIAVLTTANLRALLSTQIAALTTDQVVALTTTQALGLSSANVAAFTTDQIVAIETEDIAVLSTANLQTFSSTQILSLTTDQIVALTSTQALGLSSANIVALSTTQLIALETVDLAALSTSNVLALLIGPLEPGGFGTDVGWTNSYRNLRTAYTILEVVDKVPDYSAAQRSAVKGFVKTFIAQEYVNQLRVRDTFGLVFDVPKNPAEQGAFISRDEALHTEFALLLYGKLNKKINKQRVHEIVQEAVTIETEFICEALPCRLILDCTNSYRGKLSARLLRLG
jgi:hypothetical protein